MHNEYLNNSILIGNIYTEPELLFEEKYKYWYYYFILDIPRLNSANSDKIPIRLPQEKAKIVPQYNNLYKINGEIRSKNEYQNDKRKLIVYDYANDITEINSKILSLDDIENSNYIEYIGYIVKCDDFRKTPLGRIITDFKIAINSPIGRSYYIPSIIWNKQNARFMQKLPIGSKVKIIGRFQSRIYHENEVAYEVSVSTIELLEKSY